MIRELREWAEAGYSEHAELSNHAWCEADRLFDMWEFSSEPYHFRPARIGLTGSIGMGKSTIARMFMDRGVAVFDGDAEVHRMQGPAGVLIAPIEAAFPGTTGPEGVDRKALGAIVFSDGLALRRLEDIVRPFLDDAYREFLTQHQDRMTVYDNPLLFEMGMGDQFDILVVATAPEDIQKERVLSRPGMTEKRFRDVLARQMPDARKRAKAHFVIQTDKALEETTLSVQDIMEFVKPRAAFDRQFVLPRVAMYPAPVGSLEPVPEFWEWLGVGPESSFAGTRSYGSEITFRYTVGGPIHGVVDAD